MPAISSYGENVVGAEAKAFSAHPATDLPSAKRMGCHFQNLKALKEAAVDVLECKIDRRAAGGDEVSTVGGISSKLLGNQPRGSRVPRLSPIRSPQRRSGEAFTIEDFYAFLAE